MNDKGASSKRNNTGESVLAAIIWPVGGAGYWIGSHILQDTRQISTVSEAYAIGPLVVLVLLHSLSYSPPYRFIMALSSYFSRKVRFPKAMIPKMDSAMK